MIQQQLKEIIMDSHTAHKIMNQVNFHAAKLDVLASIVAAVRDDMVAANIPTANLDSALNHIPDDSLLKQAARDWKLAK